MSPQNPAQHARTAATALARLVKDVRMGRAQWPNPAITRQGVEDLATIAGEMAAAVQQITAALSQMSRQAPQTSRTMEALHQGGQAAAVAESQLRAALCTLRTR